MIHARTATGTKGVTAVSLRNSAGLMKVVANARTRDSANVLKLVYSSSATGAFTVSASPLTASGGRTGSGALAISSEEVVVSISGGSAPYTYLWSVVVVTSGTWSIETATADKTRFVSSSVPLGDSCTATFKCTVTDARGISSASADVTVTCTNFGDLGGILP